MGGEGDRIFMAKMDMKEEILTYMREGAFRPLSADALAEGMKRTLSLIHI